MNDALTIGTKIKARCRSLAKSNGNGDGTNDIIEPEKANSFVHKEIVKSPVPNEISIGEETNALLQLKVGDRVEAKYRGRGRRWYKGTIANILQRNGDLYDIDYDDGDRDRSLSGEFVRRLTKPSKSATSSTKDVTSKTKVQVEDEDGKKVKAKVIGVVGKDSNDHVTFGIGQRVEAKYRGRGRRWYKGTIVNILQNGDLYDIDYDDGDRDRNLRAEHIRAVAVDLIEDPKDCPYQSRDDENTPTVESSTRAIVSPKIDTISNKDSCQAEAPSLEDSCCMSDLRAESMQSVSTVSCVDNDITSPAEDVSFVAPSSNVDGRGINEEKTRVLEDTLKEDDKEGLSSPEESRHEGVSVKESTVSQDYEERTQDVNTSYSMGKGNRLYRGEVMKARIVYLYDIQYSDGTRDVNLPFSALSVNEKMTASDIQVGSEVDVISWQDRFHV